MKKSIRRVISGYLAVILCVGGCVLPAQAGLVKEVMVSDTDGVYAYEKIASPTNAVAKEEEKDSGNKKEEQKNEITIASVSTASRMNRAATEEFVIDENGILTKYNGSGPIVEVEEGVTEIGSKAFAENTNIEKVILPDTVLSIGNGAFAECTMLKSIELPESLRAIYPGAFTKCTALTEIQINSNLDDVKLGTVDGLSFAATAPFSGCSSLSAVTFGEKIIKIPANLFKGCNGLQTLDLSNTGIKEIGTFAFQNCLKLKKVILNDEMIRLNMGAFAGCTDLDTINLPKDLSVIVGSNPNSSAATWSQVTTAPFEGCSSLKDVTLDEETTIIASYLFKNCTGLENIDLSKIKTIGIESFKGCTALVGNQPEGETDKIVSLTSIQTVGANAFENCTSLRWLVFGDFTKNIEKEVLKGCTGLHHATINSHLPEMGEGIFTGIEHLTVRGFANSNVYTYVNNWNKSLSNDHYEIIFDSKGIISGFKIGKDNWQIGNWSGEGGIARDENEHKVPLKTFTNIFGPAIGVEQHIRRSDFIGYCHGFTETAKIFFQQPELFSQMYSVPDSNVFDIEDKTKKLKLPNSGNEVSVLELMEYFYVSQYLPDAPPIWAYDEKYYCHKDDDKLKSEELKKFEERTSEVIEEIIQLLEDGQVCPMQIRNSKIGLVINGFSIPKSRYRLKGSGGHAVLAFAIEENSETAKTISVYDSNIPRRTAFLYVEKRDGLWKWKYTALNSSGENTFDVGTLYAEEKHECTKPIADAELWDIGHEWDVIASVNADYNMEDFERCYMGRFYDRMKDNELVIVDGYSVTMEEYGTGAGREYVSEHSSARQISAVGGLDMLGDDDCYYIPKGKYTFTNSDEAGGLELSISSYNSTAEISASSIKTGSVSLNDDKIDDNWIILADANGKEAEVTFKCYDTKIKFDELMVRGNGTQNQVTYTLKADGNGLEVGGTALNYVEAIINGEKIEVNVDDKNGSSHIIDLSEKDGKPVVQVLDENNRVVASSDGTNTDNGGNTGNTGNGENTGDTGNNGNTGNTGDTGNSGNTGSSGNTGDTGNSGNTGDTGNTGNSGTGSGGGNSSSGSSGGSGGGSSSSGSSGGSGGGSGSSGNKGSSNTGGPATGTFGSGSLPSYVVTGTWNQVNEMWQFTDTSGLLYKNRWAAVVNPYANTAAGQEGFDWFFFDINGNMLTGWYLDTDGNYYYLNPVSDGTKGRMMTGWVWIPDTTGVNEKAL